jgi:anaerobic magnesium-protoporphyrin IX monomethyl ester cyclase
VKVLLIYPYFLDERIQAEDVGVIPVGLYYVGALLKQNHHDVGILNWHKMGNSGREIEETLREKKPDIIGFSIVHANRWGGIDIARIAKRVLPGVKIVFGGIGSTFLWQHLLKHCAEIDYIVLGEGEYSFLHLVTCLQNHKESEIPSVRGIAYRRGKKFYSTGPAGLVKDLDQLPMPSQYFTFQHVVSSRGCPSDCTFCGSPRFWGRRVRFHSPEYFVQQLEQLHQKGVSFFYISDDTFTMREDRVIEICRMIVEKNLRITWFAISRVNLISEEMLYWMRKAGCIQISFGVESGSEKIRDTLNKNIKTGDIKTAFALTRKYGILPRAYFIYGNPGETSDTIRETIDLINEIKPLSAIFYILDIFPGTALYEDFQKRTGIGEDIWLERIEDIMYFETDQRLSQDMILNFGRRLRSAFHMNLPHFADDIELTDREDLHEFHADFLSRLAMTFSHGDYSMIEGIPEKEEVAERLYSRSLSYAPNQRAYLGLGSLKQKQKRYEESIAILSEGIKHFPESDQITLCCGISHMCLGQYEKACHCFSSCPASPEAVRYREHCNKLIRAAIA